jgi:hypothetical protein
MMVSREVWYEIYNGDLYRVSENDGPRFMRRGPERISVLLCTVEEAQETLPEEFAKAVKRTSND